MSHYSRHRSGQNNGQNNEPYPDQDFRSASFNESARPFERYERDEFYQTYGQNAQPRAQARGGLPGFTSSAQSGSGYIYNQQSGVDHSGRGPKGWKRSDERIHDEVCELLARHPAIDASEIEVSVKEGIVTLKGSVDHRRSKRLVEDVIDPVSGVQDIRNELHVNQSLFNQAREIVTGEAVKNEKSKH